MNQLTQKLKSGVMTVQELPCPQLGPGMVLVRNHFSLISAGTEGSTAKSARKSLIGKAKERPQQVKQVLEVLRKQGPVQTYRAVTKKLDAYSPLGYSSAGVVIETGDSTAEGRLNALKVGDRVACAGVGYANHAEVVAVPVNLCVKLSDDADLKLASYNTLGAIAMQGVRQADMRLGESCAVIGLGLIGQLTCLMLRASGVRVVGVDVDPAAVKTARAHCAELAVERGAAGIEQTITEFSGGLGVDAVIITAGTSSLDPINFAGEIARKKGRVVVVGAVPTGFDRDPFYYRKELDLRMSCSYGPGRYDLDYEEKGIDYPPAYVRWTENRNMEAFQELVHSGKIDIDYLTTHEVALEEAPQAYDMIVNRSEPFLGIVIKYDTQKPLERGRIEVAPSRPAGKIGLAFIGAGSYAQGNLLPNLPKTDPDVVCRSVMTNTGTTSKRVAERFHFESCTDNEQDILGDESVNTVFIATRHDSHAEYVIKALEAGKHVFVEKPLAMTVEQVEQISELYATAGRQLLVGFNRRFAPYAVKLKNWIGTGPKSMMYRVNAGAIPADTWIQDKTMGGGRIIGEACHFIDFMTFMADAVPVQVYASALPDPQGLNDTVVINIEFADGSVGSINYFANGSKAMDKEYFEVYRGGSTGVLRDFRRLELHGKQTKRQKTMLPEKGQPAMVRGFIERLKNGGEPLIPFEQLRAVSLAAIAAEQSIIERLPVKLNH